MVQSIFEREITGVKVKKVYINLIIPPTPPPPIQRRLAHIFLKKNYFKIRHLLFHASLRWSVN